MELEGKNIVENIRQRQIEKEACDREVTVIHHEGNQNHGDMETRCAYA